MSEAAYTALLLWQEGARERMADDAAHIAAQDALLQEQHAALVACADALNVASRAIAAYGERKVEYHTRPKAKRRRPCPPI